MNITGNRSRAGFAWALALCIACLMTLQGVSLQAQTVYGSMAGTITDPSGGVIPGASITLTNIATAEKRTNTSDAAGSYRFVSLVPGHYKMDVEKTGFKHFTRDNLLVEVQAALRIDVPMQVGQVVEVVEVSSAAPLLQVEGGTLSQVVESRTVTEMPLNGRNVMNLIALTPGVIPQGSSSGSALGNQHGATYSNPAGWGNYQIGGGAAGQSAQFLDGVPMNVSLNNGIVLMPSQDAIQEFRVSTNNVSPEFGRFAGGVVNMATKSGANEFHGTAYEFLRNKVFNANNFFDNLNGTSRPEWTQNQYGFTAGGPIRKDKTFFYGSWEGFSLRLGDPIYARVPTDAMRDQCNQFCSQIGKAFYNMYAPANIPANPVTGFNFSGNGPSGSNGNQVTGRLDQNISDKQRLFVRYTWWGADTMSTDYFHNGYGKPGENHTTQQVVINDTYTLNPTTIIDGRVYFTYFRFDSMSPRTNKEDYSKYGPAWEALKPQMSVFYNPTPIVPPPFGGPVFFLFQNVSSNTWEDHIGASASLTKIIGAHTLKFGGEIRNAYRRSFADNNASGQFTYVPSPPTFDPYTNIIFGQPVNGSIQTALTTGARSWYYALYAADTWQLNKKLTLNLGLRWEQPGSFTEMHDRNTVLAPDAADTLTGFASNPYFSSLKGQLFLTNSSNYTDRQQNKLHWDLFSPRVGLAYRITEKTVIRVGAGLSYLPSDLQGINSPVMQATTNQWSGDVTNPWPHGILQPAGHDENFMTGLAGTSINGVLPDQKYPVAQQWNFTVGHEFGNGLMLEASYAGSKGTHLPLQSGSVSVTSPSQGVALNQLSPENVSADLAAYPGEGPLHLVNNPFFGRANTGVLGLSPTIMIGQLQRPYPQWGYGGSDPFGNFFQGNAGVSINAPYMGSSSYNSMQIKLEKRFKSGGMIMGSYTWAKLISDTDTLNGFLEDNGGVGSGGQNAYDRKADRSLASFDVPHRFQVSYTYDLPIGSGQKLLSDAKGAMNKLVSGWGINGQTTFQSGFPLNFSQSVNSSADGAVAYYFGGGPKRPMVLPNCGAGISGSAQSRRNGWFNTACFVPSGEWEFGNEPRVDSNLRAAGTNNWDLAIFKKTQIKESVGVEFRMEAFNLFNRVQFGAPSTDVNSPATFGVVTSQANRPRILQFALRLTY
ncbi:MAG TPA: TonB-dependent receptor [Acidobacteriota bacterium]|nr:TonB-dependent receptor [Acidobacteriota bacterium]